MLVSKIPTFLFLKNNRSVFNLRYSKNNTKEGELLLLKREELQFNQIKEQLAKKRKRTLSKLDIPKEIEFDVTDVNLVPKVLNHLKNIIESE